MQIDPYPTLHCECANGLIVDYYVCRGKNCIRRHNPTDGVSEYTFFDGETKWVDKANFKIYFY